MLDKIKEKILSGKSLSLKEASNLAKLDDKTTPELLALADEITRYFHQDKVELCSIVNAKSGRCSEDCRFCAQSGHYATNIEIYPLISAQKVLDKARQMKKAKASRFAIVTSGRGSNEKDFQQVLTLIKILRQETYLKIDASLGIIDEEKAWRLKEAGLDMYHHNLETSRGFFPTICTTHSYDDRIAAILAAQKAGLLVCAGGIIGLGETIAQRLELAFELRNLAVNSVPLNLLNPVPGTPLAHQKRLSHQEILKTIALYRLILPQATLRLCGGREQALGSHQALAFQAGINGMMIGGYLTTKGAAVKNDLAMLTALNLSPSI